MWNYVPCDECLRKKYVQELHICHPGCGLEEIVSKEEAEETPPADAGKGAEEEKKE
jgi:hypothetical protein